MTIQAVTTAQLEQVRKMAKDKGIGKDDFQQGLDRGVVADMLDGLKTVKPEQPIPLLTEISTVDVPAIAKFVATEHFCDGNPAGIKFWLGSTFRQNFLGKVEENVPARILAIHRLNRNSVDGPIRKQLGPEREETALAHFYELIKNQPKGEEGKLPTDGTWVIVYIGDTKNNLWAVVAYWRSVGRGWHVNAYSVEDPYEWPLGLRVVSRK